MKSGEKCINGTLNMKRYRDKDIIHPHPHHNRGGGALHVSLNGIRRGLCTHVLFSMKCNIPGPAGWPKRWQDLTAGPESALTDCCVPAPMPSAF